MFLNTMIKARIIRKITPKVKKPNMASGRPEMSLTKTKPRGVAKAPTLQPISIQDVTITFDVFFDKEPIILKIYDTING